MRAALYCRVATEDQERLQSQLEGCRNKAHELGYDVVEEFILLETYPGSTLDRPKLSELRQRVRDKEVDAVIAYSLDRLARNVFHVIILQEELESVKLRPKLSKLRQWVRDKEVDAVIAYSLDRLARKELESVKLFLVREPGLTLKLLL